MAGFVCHVRLVPWLAGALASLLLAPLQIGAQRRRQPPLAFASVVRRHSRHPFPTEPSSSAGRRRLSRLEGNNLTGLRVERANEDVEFGFDAPDR